MAKQRKDEDREERFLLWLLFLIGGMFLFAMIAAALGGGVLARATRDGDAPAPTVDGGTVTKEQTPVTPANTLTPTTTTATPKGTGSPTPTATATDGTPLSSTPTYTVTPTSTVTPTRTPTDELVCLDDPFEPNNTRSSGTAIKGPNFRVQARSCRDNDDWFVVWLEAGEELTVNVTFRHAEGDIDVQLRGPSDDVIDVSNGISDGEEVGTTATVSGVYAVLVYLYPPSADDDGNAYSLRARITAPPLVCADDDFEDNDLRAQAGTPYIGDNGVNIDAIACPFDDDWYVFEFTEFLDLHAYGELYGEQGEIRLWLYDEDGLFAQGEADDGFQYIDALLPAGTYYVLVTYQGAPYDPQQDYGYYLHVGPAD